MKSDESGSKTQIVIAVIGLIGVLGAALLTNWDRIFPHKTPPSVAPGEPAIGSPKVIATSPANGATDVDPSLSKIAVTFNRPMLDKSWSWSDEEKDLFPQVTGEPSYIENGTTCVLPVALEPGKRYVVWINTTKFKNFKDRNGVAAEPYRIEFKTRTK